jgi:hypothetical protein
MGKSRAVELGKVPVGIDNQVAIARREYKDKGRKEVAIFGEKDRRTSAARSRG